MKPSKLAIIKAFLSVKNFDSRVDLLAHQQRQLHHLLTNHHSRFYPHSSDIHAYPIINKQIFMANFERINRYGISEAKALAVALQAEQSRDFSPVIATQYGDVTVGLSSGTSGSRGIFLVSAHEAALWAGYLLRRMLPKPYWQRHRVAFFLRANSNLYTAVKSPIIGFCFYDLMQPLAAHVDALNQQNPTILIAPAQVLEQFARHQAINIMPKKIISVAEVLDDDVKQHIESRFATQVHQIYQCTEGFLAHTCSHGHLHLNEDMIYIEKDWLDKGSGRFCPIVTDFHRHSQPVIRYRLDDVLVADSDNTPCPCGSVFERIKAIEGRCDDILKATTLTGNPYDLYADFVRRALMTSDVMDSGDGMATSIGQTLQEYRVIQTDALLKIQILPDTPQLRHQVITALSQLCEQHHLQPFECVFESYQVLPLYQKRRRVIRQ